MASPVAAPGDPQPNAKACPRRGVFVDCVHGRHAATEAELMLRTRRMVWRKDYGWVYDAWVDSPSQYALAGAHGRFSLPAVARQVQAGLVQLSHAALAAGAHLQQTLQQQVRAMSQEQHRRQTPLMQPQPTHQPHTR